MLIVDKCDHNEVYTSQIIAGLQVSPGIVSDPQVRPLLNFFHGQIAHRNFLLNSGNFRDFSRFSSLVGQHQLEISTAERFFVK